MQRQKFIDRKEVRKALFPTEQGPIIASRLQDDFYKFTMGQFIYLNYPRLDVEFGFKNRTTSIRLADEINEGELRTQLDHAKNLAFAPTEIRYLANIRNDGAFMFADSYLDFLKNTSLPDYDLGVKDGQFVFKPKGCWSESTYWEIAFLQIISALRTESLLRKIPPEKVDEVVEYTASMIEEKIWRLQDNRIVSMSNFGTRRAASPLLQRIIDQAMIEHLPRGQFVGTSNTLFAKELDTMAIGTNAHELPMVIAALAENDADLIESPFKMLRQWWALYGWGLSIILPDTFGSDWMFQHMPAEFALQWKGMRPDSMDPIEFGIKQVHFYEGHGQKAQDRMLIPSDSLTLQKMMEISYHFKGKIKVSHGWGTLLTNDTGLGHPSIVVKATAVNGKPTVKLSDNIAKAMGPKAEIDRYIKAFNYRVTKRAECVC